MTSSQMIPQRTNPYKWLLIGSLALNLLVFGTVGGMALKHRFGPGPGPGGELNLWRLVNGPHGLRGFLATLPKERREVLRGSIEDQKETVRPARLAVRVARDTVISALDTEPFDDQKLISTIDAMSAAEVTARRSAVSILVTALKQMTPQERAGFQAWRKRFTLMPPPRPRDGDPPPPKQ